MRDQTDHGACVDAWMERGAEGVPSEQVVHVFEEGFGALWRRAHQTLGDVTLTAILDRVLHYSVEKYPMMAVLKAEPHGLRCQNLLEKIEGVPVEQLKAAIRFVMVEFLTVLGNLTADILTPSLHAALFRVARKSGVGEGESQAEQTDSALKSGEDAKS
jgi:hypothetical protein